MVSLAERIRNGQTNQKGLFDSVVGQIKTYEKRWVCDIDNKDDNYLLNVMRVINSCKPEGNKIYKTIPTKDGYHLITDRFDVMEFMKVFPEISVQKKNPTLLFLPESLS
jgi:hypothetical protein